MCRNNLFPFKSLNMGRCGQIFTTGPRPCVYAVCHVCFLCSVLTVWRLWVHSRLHVEVIFARLWGRCQKGLPLVGALPVGGGDGAPCRRRGGRGACGAGWRGGILSVDQLHLFRVGDSHRLREGHHDVTGKKREKSELSVTLSQWPVSNPSAKTEKNKTFQKQKPENTQIRSDGGKDRRFINDQVFFSHGGCNLVLPLPLAFQPRWLAPPHHCAGASRQKDFYAGWTHGMNL